MSTYDRFAELWTDYLEGELSESELTELKAIIESQPECKSIAIEQYQIHRALGLIAAQNSEEFVKATIQRLPKSSDDFVAQVMARANPLSTGSDSLKATRSHRSLKWLALVATVVASISLAIIALRNETRHDAIVPQASIDAVVKFTNTARSKFLGSFAPSMDSDAILDREYILTSGSVQLRFPTGAEVIVEGPAVFQIVEKERMHVSVGRCSVYCPPGAEGFAIDTPSARVVDRGTRFFVNVIESSATEVHVIDGVADVYALTKEIAPKHSPNADNSATNKTIRMTENQARTFEGETASQSTDFRSKLFQSQLPDRILSYEATQEDGGAKDLIGVRVQRDGQLKTFPAQELIGARITSFKIAEKISDMRHLAGNAKLPTSRAEVMSDLSLNTGAINPGGDLSPATTNPVLTELGTNRTLTTPGFAIEFVAPVINAPGPDVVFFELQNLTGDPDGDSFHVLPLTFSGKRKPITVNSYDLTLTSPEVQRPANFYLHEFASPVDSFDELVNGQCQVLPMPQGSVGYRVLAVAFDLSAMGFEEGEPVKGLFFQDSLDDQEHVDPVAIFGLPVKP